MYATNLAIPIIDYNPGEIFGNVKKILRSQNQLILTILISFITMIRF